MKAPGGQDDGRRTHIDHEHSRRHIERIFRCLAAKARQTMPLTKVCQTSSPLEEAALRIAQKLSRSGNAPRLAISGGSAARVLMPLAAMLGNRTSRIRLTYADERCVPFEHADSNAGATRVFGQEVGHELRLFHAGETPQSAQARATSAFDHEFGGLDVALLGLGGDGHLASHFPGVAASPKSASVQYISESPKPPAERMTLSMEVLKHARLVIFFVVGEGKRAALEGALTGASKAPAQAFENGIVVTDLKITVGQSIEPQRGSR